MTKVIHGAGSPCQNAGSVYRGDLVLPSIPAPHLPTPPSPYPRPGAARSLTVTGSSSCCSISLKLAMRKPRQALQSRRSRAAALCGSTAPATKLRGQAGQLGAAPPPTTSPGARPCPGCSTRHTALPPGSGREPTRPGQEKPHEQGKPPPQGGGSLWRGAGLAVTLPLTYLTLRSWCGPPGDWSSGVLSEGPSV